MGRREGRGGKLNARPLLQHVGVSRRDDSGKKKRTAATAIKGKPGPSL